MGLCLCRLGSRTAGVIEPAIYGKQCGDLTGFRFVAAAGDCMRGALPKIPPAIVFILHDFQNLGRRMMLRKGGEVREVQAGLELRAGEGANGFAVDQKIPAGPAQNWGMDPKSI